MHRYHGVATWQIMFWNQKKKTPLTTTTTKTYLSFFMFIHVPRRKSYQFSKSLVANKIILLLSFTNNRGVRGFQFFVSLESVSVLSQIHAFSITLFCIFSVNWQAFKTVVNDSTIFKLELPNKNKPWVLRCCFSFFFGLSNRSQDPAPSRSITGHF